MTTVTSRISIHECDKLRELADDLNLPFFEFGDTDCKWIELGGLTMFQARKINEYLQQSSISIHTVVSDLPKDKFNSLIERFGDEFLKEQRLNLYLEHGNMTTRVTQHLLTIKAEGDKKDD